MTDCITATRGLHKGLNPSLFYFNLVYYTNSINLDILKERKGVISQSHEYFHFPVSSHPSPHA